jgi:aspartate/methionine/tyrosine aminotransferase
MELRIPPIKVKYLIENPNVIREIMNLIEEAKKEPTRFPRKLIYLAGGWPQDPPPPLIKRIIVNILENEEKFLRAVQYGPTRGLTETLEAIAFYEKEMFNRKISEENIFIGNGSTELTFSLLNAIIDNDSEIILTRPHYLNYLRQIILATNPSIKVKYWNLIKDYKYDPSLDELQDLITDKTSLIILSSPGNPDAQILSDEIYKGVIEIAKDKGIFVANDIAYRGFWYSRKPQYFSKDIEENEIIICTFSKELRIPGLRIAYILSTNKEILKRLEVIEQTINLCPNNLSQKIIAELLGNKENIKIISEFVEKGRLLYKQVSELTYENIKNLESIYALKPEAGFYVFFNHEKIERKSKKFCSDLLLKRQVALAPGYDFGLDGWTRLSFSSAVLNPEIIKEGIARINEFIEEEKQIKGILG